MNTKLRFVLIFAVGIGLLVPTIFQDFIVDDPLVLSVIEDRYSERPNAFDIYSVLFPQLEQAWWISPDIESEFFRPLGSALLRFDYAVFGRWAPGWHLHSLLWKILFLVSLALLYERLDPKLGWLALLFFALDESFANTAGFISNRHALTAMTFSVFALWAHLKWREDGWRPGLPLASLGLVLSLLTAETGLVTFAYLGAYEIFAGPGNFRRKAQALTMPVIIGLVYVTWYRSMGYGYHGGASEAGMYIDPGADPALFIKEAFLRIPALLGGGILGTPCDLWMESTKRVPLVIGGIVGIILLLTPIGLGWSSLPEYWRRNLKWLLPGALLSCVPLVGTFPSHRQMTGPLVGIVPALVAVLYLVQKVWWPAGSWRRWTAAALGFVLILIHGVLAPIMMIVIPRVMQDMHEGIVRNLESVPHWDPAEGFDEVVALQSPEGVTMSYGPVFLDDMHHSSRGFWTILSEAPFDHRWTRTGPQELELEILNGEMLTTFPEINWPARKGLVPGGALEFRGIEIRIIEVGEQGPRKLAFKMSRSLDDPKLLLLAWVGKRFERFVPPPVGESVVLPWSEGYLPLL